jgi:hypothetical protein
LLIAEPKNESGPKELRVKIGVEYHLKLHALKLLRGKRMSEAVEEALSSYFERVRVEHESANGEGSATALVPTGPGVIVDDEE